MIKNITIPIIKRNSVLDKIDSKSISILLPEKVLLLTVLLESGIWIPILLSVKVLLIILLSAEILMFTPQKLLDENS